MKKILSLILVVVIFSMSCCSKNEQASVYSTNIKFTDEELGGLKLPLSKENATLTMMTIGDGNYNDLPAICAIEEVTGINLEITSIQESTFSEKLSTLIAANQLTDIFPMTGTYQQVNDLAMQGAFVAVNDYMDKMPNFKSLFVDNPDNSWVMKSYAAPDGKLYIIPDYETVREVNSTMMYRKDIFDKHGLKMWTNNEEFYQTLKKLKELYPNSTPFTGRGLSMIDRLSNAGLNMTNSQRVIYDSQKDTFIASDTSSQMKEALIFARKLYNEGLIDPEFLTLTLPAFTQKMSQADKAFVTADWVSRMDMITESASETVPGFDLRFAPPTGNGKLTVNNPIVFGSALECVTKNKNSELAMKFIDFLLSPAGAELSTAGVEGEIYTLNERGYASYKEFPDTVPTINDIESKYGLHVLVKRADKRSSYFDVSERLQEANKYIIDNPELKREFAPVVFLTEEEKDITMKNATDIQKKAEEMMMKFITDANPEKVWDNWLKTAEKLQISEMVSVYNKAYERQKKEM